ncbi:23S rRNA (uracil-5-)-methyltransferase RumA [Synechococcus sp. PCC 7502]|uniref:23S rRNA (uracil(1939)-C(5))-methyltransferase RlmD n=1 Tax=Synechococcus sp. PCC 7502 TaxID=1173263 RepID=UPI00029FE3D6|nr:23S rRNA (uracil(1939)-C(5))-methyltransferase RlmD [Synechococcus sp. PCC 7502]AFY74825.1 23S rRNA (uracil-5-)-methyltransferase RumA [Synechococcus sp. PCC 7502]
MQQDQIISLEITDLSDSGDGVGRYQDLAIFVADTVPGDRIEAKLTFVKPNLAHARLEKILSPSPHRVRSSCIVADKCGGCQWQVVSYEYQLEAKQNQVVQALQRIGGFSPTEISSVISEIIPAPDPLQYRNKVSYPLAMDNSKNEHRLKIGYYQKRSHKIVNINQCPVQDQRLDPFLAGLKRDIRKREWQIYDENTHRGLLRHISLRIGRNTGEILLTLVAKDWEVPKLELQAPLWLEAYPNLVGVMLNRNGDRTNTILGEETRCIAGRDYIEEIFAGLRFQLRADTFFQVYTEQAEALVNLIQRELQLQKTDVIVDAYSGVGTLTLPLSKKVKQAIALEIQPQATIQAEQNAKLNGIRNVRFHTGTVEELLPQLDLKPDVILLDPPRKGCHPEAIAYLCQSEIPRLVYVSCNPATLARDLRSLVREGSYKITKLQPLDFFPQTAHVETVAFLTKV